jgi:flagellar capping protein FliD
MAGMSVSGLATGIDTASLVSQLVALEQAKVTRVENQRKAVETTMTKFNDLKSKLGNLAAKADALNDMKDWNVFKSLSNNSEYVTVTGGEGATAGNYGVKVNQLATNQKVASASFESSTTKLGMSGSFFISRTDAAEKTTNSAERGKGVEIKVNENDSLKDIVNRINATEGVGAKASIMTLANGETRLVLSSVDSGTTGFTIKNADGGNDILGGTYKDKDGNPILDADSKEIKGLGLIDESYQKAATSGALVTLDGKAADGTTKWSEINTTLNKNNLVGGDKLSVALGASPSKNYDLFEKDASGNYIKDAEGKYVSRTVQDVLDEINTDLAWMYGEDEKGNNALTASINASGELTFQTDPSKFGYDKDGNPITSGVTTTNFDDLSKNLSSVKIEITDDGTSPKSKYSLGSVESRSTFTNVLNEAKNAFYMIDGMAVSAQSNSDSSTIAGTTYTLKQVTSDLADEVKVSLEQDTDALVNKVKEIMEEMNALLKFIDENQKRTTEEKTDETTGKKGKVTTDGAFSGDYAIQSLEDNLKRMFTSSIDALVGKTNYTSMSRVGITTGRDGYFTLDTEDLKKALNTDFDGVRRLFSNNGFSDTPGVEVGRWTNDTVTGTYQINLGTGEFSSVSGENYGGKGLGSGIFSATMGKAKGLSVEVADGLSGSANVTFVRGIAAQLSTYVDKANAYNTGFFATTKDTYQKRIDQYDERIEQLQLRVDNYNDRLTRQFSAMETAMSNLTAQTSNMLAALGTR